MITTLLLVAPPPDTVIFAVPVFDALAVIAPVAEFTAAIVGASEAYVSVGHPMLVLPLDQLQETGSVCAVPDLANVSAVLPPLAVSERGLETVLMVRLYCCAAEVVGVESVTVAVNGKTPL